MMRQSFSLIISIGYLLSRGCDSKSTLGYRMMGGKPVNLGELTSLATVVKFDDDIIHLICENVLISTLWILTHVQCRMMNQQLHAIFGKTILHNTEEANALDYSRKILNGYWAEDQYVSYEDKEKHPLGLFFLEQPVDSQGTVPAALVKSLTRDTVNVIGWFEEQDADIYQKLDLRYDTLPIVNEKQCKQLIRDHCPTNYNMPTLDQLQFCTAAQSKGILMTSYESGTPIFVGDNQVIGFVHEVANGTASLSGCPTINVYVRDERDFINNYVANVKWID